MSQGDSAHHTSYSFPPVLLPPVRAAPRLVKPTTTQATTNPTPRDEAVDLPSPPAFPLRRVRILQRTQRSDDSATIGPNNDDALSEDDDHHDRHDGNDGIPLPFLVEFEDPVMELEYKRSRALTTSPALHLVSALILNLFAVTGRVVDSHRWLSLPVGFFVTFEVVAVVCAVAFALLRVAARRALDRQAEPEGTRDPLTTVPESLPATAKVGRALVEVEAMARGTFLLLTVVGALLFKAEAPVCDSGRAIDTHRCPESPSGAILVAQWALFAFVPDLNAAAGWSVLGYLFLLATCAFSIGDLGLIAIGSHSFWYVTACLALFVPFVHRDNYQRRTLVSLAQATWSIEMTELQRQRAALAMRSALPGRLVRRLLATAAKRLAGAHGSLPELCRDAADNAVVCVTGMSDYTHYTTSGTLGNTVVTLHQLFTLFDGATETFGVDATVAFGDEFAVTRGLIRDAHGHRDKHGVLAVVRFALWQVAVLAGAAIDDATLQVNSGVAIGPVTAGLASSAKQGSSGGLRYLLVGQGLSDAQRLRQGAAGGSVRATQRAADAMLAEQRAQERRAGHRQRHHIGVLPDSSSTAASPAAQMQRLPSFTSEPAVLSSRGVTLRLLARRTAKPTQSPSVKPSRSEDEEQEEEASSTGAQSSTDVTGSASLGDVLLGSRATAALEGTLGLLPGSTGTSVDGGANDDHPTGQPMVLPPDDGGGGDDAGAPVAVVGGGHAGGDEDEEEAVVPVEHDEDVLTRLAFRAAAGGAASPDYDDGRTARRRSSNPLLASSPRSVDQGTSVSSNENVARSLFSSELNPLTLDFTDSTAERRYADTVRTETRRGNRILLRVYTVLQFGGLMTVLLHAGSAPAWQFDSSDNGDATRLLLPVLPLLAICVIQLVASFQPQTTALGDYRMITATLGATMVLSTVAYIQLPWAPIARDPIALLVGSYNLIFAFCCAPLSFRHTAAYVGLGFVVPFGAAEVHNAWYRHFDTSAPGHGDGSRPIAGPLINVAMMAFAAFATWQITAKAHREASVLATQAMRASEATASTAAALLGVTRHVVPPHILNVALMALEQHLGVVSSPHEQGADGQHAGSSATTAQEGGDSTSQVPEEGASSNRQHQWETSTAAAMGLRLLRQRVETVPLRVFETMRDFVAVHIRLQPSGAPRRTAGSLASWLEHQVCADVRPKQTANGGGDAAAATSQTDAEIDPFVGWSAIAELAETVSDGTLRLVQALGDDAVIGGPWQHHLSARSVSVRQRDSRLTSAACGGVLLARALASGATPQIGGLSFTAAVTIDEACGAMIGAASLRYRVLGAAVREAGLLIAAAPAGPGKQIAVASRAIVLRLSPGTLTTPTTTGDAEEEETIAANANDAAAPDAGDASTWFRPRQQWRVQGLGSHEVYPIALQYCTVDCNASRP